MGWISELQNELPPRECPGEVTALLWFAILAFHCRCGQCWGWKLVKCPEKNSRKCFPCEGSGLCEVLLLSQGWGLAQQVPKKETRLCGCARTFCCIGVLSRYLSTGTEQEGLLIFCDGCLELILSFHLFLHPELSSVSLVLLCSLQLCGTLLILPTLEFVISLAVLC